MELPTPRSFELGDITGDCAICYAYHLPTCAPVVCAPVWHIRTAGMDTPRRAPCPEGSLAHGGCACRANGNGSSVPEHSCDNEACGRPYHASCLQEWCAPLYIPFAAATVHACCVQHHVSRCEHIEAKPNRTARASDSQ
jgi:hypothetical protein